MTGLGKGRVGEGRVGEGRGDGVGSLRPGGGGGGVEDPCQFPGVNRGWFNGACRAHPHKVHHFTNEKNSYSLYVVRDSNLESDCE